MTVFVEIDARPSLVARSSNAPPVRIAPADGRIADLAQRLKAAYAVRVEAYKAQLRDALEGNAQNGFGASRSAFPETSLVLDEEEVALAIDENLYTSLFDLYVFYGWKGVRVAEEAVRVAGSKRRDLAWSPARSFFRFTRNALALVIRETLIGIEGAAAASVFDRLGQINRQMALALAGDLRFDVVPEHEVRQAKAPNVQVPARYTLRDRSFAKTLFTAVRTAVDARAVCDRLIKKKREVEQELQEADVGVANESSPGYRSPSSGDGDSKARRRRAELADQAIDAALPEAMNNLHGAQRQVHSNSALALLVLPGLPELCTQEQTENALGTALFTLGQEVDGVRKAIRRGWSRAQADLRGLRDAKPGAAQPIDPWEIESLYGPNLRIEHDLIGIARFGVRDDPGYVALLHGGTWQELIRNGVIGRDSFEYVVANYWLVALKEQAAEAVKRSDAMARTLAIASSALSLLAVVLPPVAPVAVASDLALLAFTVYGAARQLGNLDDKLRIELPTLASGGYEALSAAGELAAEIPSIREQLTLEVLKQLALLPLSQIRLVGEVLNARAYVEDVITLIQASDGG